MFEPQTIPGMIEPGEQELLTALAGSAPVADAGLIVEFGTFFGRSTASLLNGAASWWTPERPGPAVRAYDSFGCSDAATFAPHVRAAARQGGVEALVGSAAGRLDFLPAFRHFVGAAEDRGLLEVVATELRDAQHDGAPIGLMHLDAPKYYQDLKPVLFRFFPSLATGGYVVFQDYFFHWSATLIAAAELLAQAGILELQRSVASSAVAQVLRAPRLEELAELDLAMLNTPTERLLDDALKRAAGMQVDRPDEFVPRVHLAKVQHLWEAGRHAEAQQALAGMMQSLGGRFPAAAFSDFMQLMRFGFDLRELYERDH